MQCIRMAGKKKNYTFVWSILVVEQGICVEISVCTLCRHVLNGIDLVKNGIDPVVTSESLPRKVWYDSGEKTGVFYRVCKWSTNCQSPSSRELDCHVKWVLTSEQTRFHSIKIAERNEEELTGRAQYRMSHLRVFSFLKWTMLYISCASIKLCSKI